MNENPPKPDAQIVDIASRLKQSVEQAAKSAPQVKEPSILEDQICKHCGCLHVINCPRTKKMRFYASGELEEIEFFPWNEWVYGPTKEEQKLIEAGEMEDHSPLAHIIWPDAEMFYVAEAPEVPE